MSAELRIPIDITETVTVKHEGPQRPDTPARADDPALSRPTATAQQTSVSKPSSASQTAAQQPQQAPPPKPSQQGPQRRFSEEQWAELTKQFGEKDRDALAKQYGMQPPESAQKSAAPVASSAPSEIQDEAARQLERRARQRAVEQEMRVQDPEYGKQADAKDEARADLQARREERAVAEQRYAQMTDEERMAEKVSGELQRREEAKTVHDRVDALRRSTDDAYRVQQEEIERRRELAQGIGELVDQRREERLALERMSDAERVEYLAAKEFERRREADAIKERVDRMKGKGTFDPYAAAEKSRESQVKREQIRAASEEMYGKEQKSTSDAALDLAQKFRGTIGGVLGTVAGGTLDFLSAMREEAKKNEKSPARIEAEKRNAEMQGVAEPRRAEQPTGATPPPPAANIPPEERTEQEPQSVMQRIGDTLGFGKAKEPPKVESKATAKPLPEAKAAPASAPDNGSKAVAKPLPMAKAAPSVAAPTTTPMAGLQGAAGPAGIALAAGLAAKEALEAVKNGAVSLTRGLGETTASLARFDDGTTRLDQVGQALGTFGDRVQTVNPILGTQAAVAGQATQNIAMLSREVQRSAQRLSEYSPHLAVQQGQHEVRDIMRELHRAQRFGQSMERTNEARYSMEDRLQQLFDRLLPPILAMGEKIFRGVEIWMSGIDEILKAMLNALDGLLANAEEATRRLIGAGAVVAEIRRIRDILAAMLEGDTPVNDPLFNRFASMGRAQPNTNILPLPPRPTQPIMRP